MQIANLNNAIRNIVYIVLVLSAASLLGRNFSGATTTTSTAPARHYYLTQGFYNGNQPLTACSSGYHFASFAELSDPPLLAYNKNLGRSNADDGAGPPSAAYGWVRSGYASNSVYSSGYPTNCSLWTSSSSTDTGEIGVYDPNFTVPSGASTVVPVVTFEAAYCSSGQEYNIGVWCVEN